MLLRHRRGILPGGRDKGCLSQHLARLFRGATFSLQSETFLVFHFHPSHHHQDWIFYFHILDPA